MGSGANTLGVSSHSKKKVLILGGKGFLANILANSLEDYSVALASRELLELSDSTFQNIQIDWDDKESIVNACRGIDIIIHAAGPDSSACSLDPFSAYDFFNRKLSNLLDAANVASVQKIIFFSTAHVYKSPLVGKIDEKTDCENTHPYAISRLLGEYTLKKRAGGIGIEVLRLPNIFGYPQTFGENSWKLFVNNIAKQLVDDKKIVLSSNGNGYRCFCPAAKFVEEVRLSIETQSNFSIRNITGECMSLKDMASRLLDVYTKRTGESALIHYNLDDKSQREPLEFKSLNDPKLSLDIESELSNLLTKIKRGV